MSHNIQAPNINWSKPVRTVPTRAKGKCPVCRDTSTFRLNVKGNVGTLVKGTMYGKCANKKCPTKPDIKLEFNIKIT